MSIAPTTVRIPPSTRPSRLRDARVYAGFTQAQMAELLGKTRQTVSNYERGETEPDRAVTNLWADECDVDRIWLWSGLTIFNGGPNDGAPSELTEKITNRYLASAAGNVSYARFGREQEAA